MRRSTAPRHYEGLILVSVSDRVDWFSAAMSVLQVRGTTAPMQDRQGRSAHPSLLSMGGNSNARLRACTAGTVRAAGVTVVLKRAKGFYFSVLYNVASRCKYWASQ